MQTKQITINIYDVGDILDISELGAKYVSKRERLDTAKRALVIDVIELRNGQVAYQTGTDETKRVRLIPEELGKEKYIGHVDLSMLFDE